MNTTKIASSPYVCSAFAKLTRQTFKVKETEGVLCLLDQNVQETERENRRS